MVAIANAESTTSSSPIGRLIGWALKRYGYIAAEEPKVVDTIGDEWTIITNTNPAFVSRGPDTTVLIVPNGMLVKLWSSGSESTIIKFVPCSTSEARRWIRERLAATSVLP
jgi:hypothetical protein